LLDISGSDAVKLHPPGGPHRRPRRNGSRPDMSCFTMSNSRHVIPRTTCKIGIFPSNDRTGGARRDRTDDLMLAKHALSQLSYGPNPLGQLARE
jgi:hypothetical protein